MLWLCWWRASDPILGEDDHRNAARRAPSIQVAVGMQGIAREGQHIPDVQVVAIAGDDDLDPAIEAGEILAGPWQMRRAAEPGADTLNGRDDCNGQAFHPSLSTQRAGLLLVNDKLFVGFAANDGRGFDN